MEDCAFHAALLDAVARLLTVLAFRRKNLPIQVHWRLYNDLELDRRLFAGYTDWATEHFFLHIPPILAHGGYRWADA